MSIRELLLLHQEEVVYVLAMVWGMSIREFPPLRLLIRRIYKLLWRESWGLCSSVTARASWPS